MKQQFYYFNDRTTVLSVSLETLGNQVRTIGPHSGSYLEIEVPDGMVMFIKLWEHNQMLISFIAQKNS